MKILYCKQCNIGYACENCRRTTDTFGKRKNKYNSNITSAQEV